MNYILRDIDPRVWQQFKVQTVKDGITIKEVLLKSIAEYVHRKPAKREGKQG